MITIKTPRDWARLGLIIGSGLSVLGNVSNTVLTDSTVSLGQRIPLAVVWPATLFVAAEILVRVPWRNRLLDWIGRIVLTPIAAVAAIVSYLHIHHFMNISGEVDAASILGPLAVDGLMLGSTIALLSIRAATLAEDAKPALLATPKVITPSVFETMRAEYEAKVNAAAGLARLAPEDRPESSNAGDILVNMGHPLPRPARKPRPVSAMLASGVRMLLEDVPLDVVAKDTELGVSTLARYKRAIRLVREDQNVKIDCVGAKLRPELLDVIRHHIANETAEAA